MKDFMRNGNSVEEEIALQKEEINKKLGNVVLYGPKFDELHTKFELLVELEETRAELQEYIDGDWDIISS